MALPFFNWSRTASNNATADSTVNWQEGQAPSSVNDSARAMMASTAAFRDDIAGAIVTAGTSTAYTVTSYQVFDTLAHMSGQMIAFTPHTQNTGACTLNVDGLGAKALRSAPNVELPSGTILQGTPYVATYNNTDGAWYLQGFIGNPYNVPIGAGMDFWGSTAPNSSFVLLNGATTTLSRTTYSALFGIIGTTYGVGDGSTTFGIPDKRGRVSVGNDNGFGRISGAVFSSTGPGGTGGAESITLNATQIPSITSVNPSSIALSVTTSQKVVNGPNQGSATAGGSQVTAADPGSGGALSTVASTGTIGAGSAAVTSNNTGGASHPNVQPSIVCNYIMRII